MTSKKKPPTPWAPGQQDRSRRTTDRIVAAALELLGEKGFDAMTVVDIASRAEISVGGFYARFRGKAALLQYFNETILEGAVETIREQLSRDLELDARSVIERFITVAVSTFRRHRAVLKQVALRSRTSNDPGFPARIREINRDIHDFFRERLYEHLDEVQHPDPRTAIDIALTAVSGAMREYILFAELRPQFDPVEDSRLVEELTTLFCSYLGLRS